MTSPLLGLDIGYKRTGVALSESGMLAHPLTVLEAKPPHMTNVVQEVIELLVKYEVRTLVIGLPLGENEELTSQALKTDHTTNQIEAAIASRKLPVEIVRVNEFHSSLDAQQLYPTVPLDAAAAAVILQDYLDQHTSP
jgi:putative Holliday junction resolvase